MNLTSDSNTYEFNAASALEQFAAYVQGTPNNTLAVIATRALTDEAHTALESSAERLGFGREGIFWVVCEPDGAPALTPETARELLTACDPLAFVATDTAASHLLGSAFEQECPLDSAARLQGCTIVAFTNFTGMLASPETKQHAWSLLKKLSS